jgi:hypothetical protein
MSVPRRHRLEMALISRAVKPFRRYPPGALPRADIDFVAIARDANRRLNLHLVLLHAGCPTGSKATTARPSQPPGHGLTPLSVRFFKLGIGLELIKPSKP